MIDFQTFCVWALLLIVHTWNSSPIRLQCTCCTVPTTSWRPHGIPPVWACQWPSSQPLSSPQLSHNDSLQAWGITKSHREHGLDYRESEELSWCPSWTNSLWQGWSNWLVYCPGGNATDPIWRVLASSQGISSWTPLKPQHSNPNPNPLANQLWCIDFLTPPTPLIIPHRPACLPWMPQKCMECFRLLFEHLAWIEHEFLSGIRDSRKAGNLWGMMRGVGGVRKSIHQSWSARELGFRLRLLCWGFKGVHEEIPWEEASTLQIGSVEFPAGQCTSLQLYPCHRLLDQDGH